MNPYLHNTYAQELCKQFLVSERSEWGPQRWPLRSAHMGVCPERGRNGQEEDMERLVGLGSFLGGLGILLGGIGVLYGVSVWSQK